MWGLLGADLHAVYGIDLADMPDRGWFWLLWRIRRIVLDPTTAVARATSRR